MTAWRRSLLVSGRSAATVNQALSAVTLLFQVGANLKIAVKNALHNRTTPSKDRLQRPLRQADVLARPIFRRSSDLPIGRRGAYLEGWHKGAGVGRC